eukprot:scaffold34586_cov99-Skeletonema_dohrnii-CCMP3373.AAC.2
MTSSKTDILRKRKHRVSETSAKCRDTADYQTGAVQPGCVACCSGAEGTERRELQCGPSGPCLRARSHPPPALPLSIFQLRHPSFPSFSEIEIEHKMQMA